MNPIPPDDELHARRKMRKARRRGYTCDRCGNREARLGDHLVHISLVHQGEPRRLRMVSCHRCATEIDINTTRTCSQCGFELPASSKDQDQ